MKVAGVGSGTPKEATKESILASELSKLTQGRDKMKKDNEAYIERHPELRTLLDEFVVAAIANKPADLVKFGAVWFATLRREGGMGHAPLCITGPSGAGKTSLVKMLTTNYPFLFANPIETTTRTPKPEEVNGRDFHFVSEGEFQAMVERGEFVEYHPVYQNFYGVTVRAAEMIRTEGKIALFDVGVEYANKIKSSSLDSKYLFIAPPSIEDLEDRLRLSDQYNETIIAQKVEAALDELDVASEGNAYDAFIINTELEHAYAEVIYTMMGWYSNVEFEVPAFSPEGQEALERIKQAQAALKSGKPKPVAEEKSSVSPGKKGGGGGGGAKK